MIVAPIFHVEQIEGAESERALVAWGHKMGPCKRPMGRLVSHGFFAHGKMLALTVTADLVRETCAGLTRAEAIELARLCAAEDGICRPVLRLWRQFIFPAFGKPWGVSYQDEALHTGNTYRFDGWVQLRERCRSGTDQRSHRKGRSKTVWGWNADPEARAAMKMARGAA
jgi:antitoxin VapB